MNKIVDLRSDEMPFINTKLGEALIDFEDYVNPDTYVRGWYQNQVKGRVGDQPIKRDLPVTMLWETGHANKNPAIMKYCNYEATDSYESKTVPVIYDMS